MKRTLLVILTIMQMISGNMLYARKQGQAFIDSLQETLKLQNDDTVKAELLYMLSFSYRNTDPESGIRYGLQSLELSARLGWAEGIAWANNCIGVNYYCKSAYPEALKYLGAVLQQERRLSNLSVVAAATSNMANIYVDEGNYPKALDAYYRALKALEAMGNMNGAAGINANISSVYETRGDYSKALMYNNRAKAIFEELENKEGVIMTLNGTGNIHRARGDNAAAVEAFTAALKLSEELGDKSWEATNLQNIGSAYIAQREYLLAVSGLSQALEIDRELGSEKSVANDLCSIGHCFALMAEAKPAKFIRNSENNYFPTRYKPRIYIPTERAALLREAIAYLKKGIEMAEALNNLSTQQYGYARLSDAYTTYGNYEAAFSYYQKYISVKDSAFSTENNKKILQQQMQYEYGRREDSLNLVTARREKEAELRFIMQRNYTIAGVGGVLLLAIFSLFTVKNSRLLAREKKRSDELLLNILPGDVAAELKEKGSIEARSYDQVTVLFADFINFNEVSKRLPHDDLIGELDHCFRAFDEIMIKHGLEKIKSIGHAYLAVCGLPRSYEDHAARVVSAAIEINTFMQERYARLGDRTFRLRTGIHSGSVIAGIVGVEKFAFDIWGDTVNTAARMEQHGETGRINISHATRQLLSSKFDCTYRGEVDAKNKGLLKMYFVDTDMA